MPDFTRLIGESGLNRQNDITINYIERQDESIEREFTEALAQGGGPDLIILSQDQFWQSKTKLIPIPYQSISERDFKEVFIEEGEIFLQTDGIYGLPFMVDPMVLYYNRDLLSSAGLAKPMAYWDEIYSSA